MPAWLGILVAVAGAVAFVPAPTAFRMVVIGVAVTLLARGSPSRPGLPDSETIMAR